MSATDFGRTDFDDTDLDDSDFDDTDLDDSDPDATDRDGSELDRSDRDGTELWIQMPGSPLARRLFVGRVDGLDGPVLALVGDAGPRVLAVLLDDEAELELADLLASLPDAALAVRDAEG